MGSYLSIVRENFYTVSTATGLRHRNHLFKLFLSAVASSYHLEI